MGAFLYCSKHISDEKIRRVLETRGHRDVKSVGENYSLTYAEKILTPTKNHLNGEELGGKDKDYIVGVGTYFYGGSFGVEALAKVWKNLEEVLVANPVYGHWAFVAHKNDKTYVFNDMSGTLRLYYTEENGQITVSSSLLSTIATLKNPKFDRMLLTAYLASHYGGENSPVAGVKNVDPLKYLVIEDSGSYQWIDRKVSETKRIESLDEAVAYVKGLFQEQMNQLKPAIGDEKVSIELTAGLDSRLIASNLRSSGLNYEFINYPLFGPDLKVSKQIADGLGKRILMQTNESCTKDFEDHYGEFDFAFNFFRQYANPRWKIENRIQFSGARGECLDTPDIYSDEDVKMMADPRLEKLIPPLTVTDMMDDSQKEKYIAYLNDLFVERGFSTNRTLTEQEQSDFGQMLCGQFTADYMYNSGVQAHIYFYQIYNEWHFNHNIMNIAFDVKKGRKLTLRLIKEIDPELASYPFVSRRRTKRNSVKEVNELPVQYFSYNGIKKMLPKWLVNKLYERMGRSFPKDRFNDIDIEYYRDVVKVDEIKKHPNLYYEILNRMYSIEMIRKIMKIE